MNFVEVVRAELMRIQAPARPESFDDAIDQIARRGKPVLDAAGARLQLIDALERRQSREKGKALNFEFEFERWQKEDRVVRFSEVLAALLKQSIGRDATPGQLGKMIGTAIARRLGLDDSLASAIKDLELDRLAELSWNHTGGDPASEWKSANEYVVAIRAVARREAKAPIVSPIGQVFLQLTGKDAIRWLLNVEAAQSTGSRDDWRVSRQTARTLLKKRERSFDWNDEIDWPHSWRTLRRLQALDLLDISDLEVPEITVLKVLAIGVELLTEIAEGTETAMSVFAATLSQDLTTQAAQNVIGSTTAIQNEGATTATRQARLVAHEIRNALVPVRIALDGLYRDLGLESHEEVLARQRPTIDEGIHRALNFVGQLLNIATLSSKPPERFVLHSVVRDATVAGHVNFISTLDGSLPVLIGNRERVRLAFTNLIDNAKKASVKEPATVQISAQTEKDGSVIVIHVDDDGPGVPEEQREDIFKEGYTTTAGSSGLGLALVREVFETEMRGRVTCDQAPSGGARFTIRIPVSSAEQS